MVDIYNICYGIVCCSCVIIIMAFQAATIASFVIGILMLIPVEPFTKNITLGIVLIVIGVLFGLSCSKVKIKRRSESESDRFTLYV